MAFYTDVADTRAFQTAEADTVHAVQRVMQAVEAMTDAVHGLDVRGEFADTWKRAVTTFDTTSRECTRNCQELAAAAALHGRNTDHANTEAAARYQQLAQAATGLV